MTPQRPELDEIVLADAPEAWERLGFTVVDGVVPLGGVRIRLGGDGPPRWSLRNLEDTDLAGLPTAVSHAPPPEPVEHPNGAVAVDHVVALTEDLDATAERLRAAGLDHRRTRDAGGGMRQAFFVIGPCLLELAGPVEGGGTRFWGMTIVAPEPERFGEHVGRVKDAVQPGRRIATVRREEGLQIAIAVMTPR